MQYLSHSCIGPQNSGCRTPFRPRSYLSILCQSSASFRRSSSTSGALKVIGVSVCQQNDVLNAYNRNLSGRLILSPCVCYCIFPSWNKSLTVPIVRIKNTTLELMWQSRINLNKMSTAEITATKMTAVGPRLQLISGACSRPRATAPQTLLTLAGSRPLPPLVMRDMKDWKEKDDFSLGVFPLASQVCRVGLPDWPAATLRSSGYTGGEGWGKGMEGAAGGAVGRPDWPAATLRSSEYTGSEGWGRVMGGVGSVWGWVTTEYSTRVFTIQD